MGMCKLSQDIIIIMYLMICSCCQLSREWVAESAGGGVGRTVMLGGGALVLRLRLLPPERSARRVPSAKPGALFGNKITHVAKYAHIFLFSHKAVRQLSKKYSHRKHMRYEQRPYRA